MGSGFSACTGPTSVGVAETGRRTQQTLNKSGGVHSDSCDSGISISEGNRKCKARHSVTSRHAAAPDLDSEEEGVAGADVACGTDFLMTSTPRPAAPKLPGGRSAEKSGACVGGGQDEVGQGEVDEDRTQGRSASKSLKHSPYSAPNLLLDHAIHEEDEEAHDGEPEDKRLRAQRPPRPKSAHFRKSRAQAHRSRTAHSLSKPQAARASAGGSLSGGESSADNMSSDEGEEDFDSDILSIPDETSQRQQQQPGGNRGRPNTLTTIKLGPQFQAQTKIHDGAATTTTTTTRTHNNTTTTTIADSHDLSNNDSMDWWTEEDGDGSARAKDSCRSRGSNVTLPSSSRGWPEGRVAKKCLQEIEQELRASTLTLCAKEEVTREDYYHAVTSLRPRFLRLLGDFKMASGEVLGRLPVDCQHIVHLEECFAQRMVEMTHNTRGPLELGPLVTQHLQDLEELCEREAALPYRPIGPLVMPANRRQALWDESGVEDESDSMEEDLQGSAGAEFAEPLPLHREGDSGNSAGSHDGHVNKEAGDRRSAGLTSLPPRGSCKSARPASLASSMSSSRARSSARRPPTEVSVLSGSKVHTVFESEGSVAGASTTSNATTTTTIASSSGSRCSTSKGGRKSRPDSGIVVSSCSASYSSSEANRETDADLAAQTEWIATSLEMLEQILQVRTESHDTLKSLVDAITHGSTSEQLKAHALYRWLASQSMPYYAKCKTAKPNSPTGKLRQLADGKICYAALYQEMAKAAGLKCEKIDGYAKGPDYRPGTPVGGSSGNQFKHSWNAVLLGGHYHFLDAGFGALPCKFFVEHFFMTPPDEMRLSHFPRDKRWLLMTQSLSTHDFEGTLKTWPTMFAFNIRPLNMKSVLRSYDGRLSITVLLRNVAVSPQLEYVGPGTPQDADALAFNIDQEIRNVDNAETFHLNLAEEGTYYFTLMVHDLEEDEDIPAFQYRVEYKDELL